MTWQKPNTNHARFKHGRSNSTEYAIWRGMIRRCHDTTNSAYRFYGARGVTVCDAWRSDFVEFFRDMGARPSQDHSIDRIDTTGPYAPENCRWATREQQANNTRSNARLTFNGETLTVSQWARKIGVCVATLSHRIMRGWPLEKDLSFKADMAPLPRRPRKTPVALCHCGRRAVARALCQMHYARARDTGSMPVKRACRCGRPHYAKGQCRKCYAKEWWAARAHA